MKIVAHCLVYNEESYLWYAVKSVIEHVDHLMLWDTGSTDRTGEIIKLLKNKYEGKITVKQIGKQNGEGLKKARQKMIEETKEDWILVLDGDEVWWQDSILKLVKTIKNERDSIDAIVVPFINLVGDMYHVQDEKAGKYRMLDKTGFLTIKAINRNIPGLHVDMPYPYEGFFDNENKPIQERDAKKIRYIDTPFLHLSHLERSRNDQSRNKIKHDLGKRLPKNFEYPEVLHQDPPISIVDIWEKRKKSYMIKAALKSPVQYIWRRIK